MSDSPASKRAIQESAETQITPRFDRSLTRETLIKMAVRIAVAVALITLVTYLYIFSVLQSQALHDLENYNAQRGELESQFFKLAMDNQRSFVADLTQRLQSPQDQALAATIESRFLRHSDGSLRMREAFFERDHITGVINTLGGSGVRIEDDEFTFTKKLGRILSIAYDMLAQYGPAWHNRFVNLYVTLPDNSILMYWPGTPWGLRAELWEINAKQSYTFSQDEAVVVIGESRQFSESPMWSHLHYDYAADDWMAAVTLPVVIDGEHILSVSNDILLQELFTSTISEQLAGTYNIILDEQGRLIAHPQFMDAIQAHGGNFSVDDANDPNLKRIFTLLSPDQQGVIDNPVDDEYLAISSLAGPGWYFVTVFPKSIIAELATKSAWTILIIGFALLVLEISIFYVVLKKQVADPLNTLMEATSRITDGDFSIKMKSEREDEVGHLAHMFNIMSTEVNMRESALNKAREELEDRVQTRTEELRIARDAAEAATEAKSEFLASMSHEIRTPLNAILGMLYLMSRSELPHDQLDRVGKAQIAAKSLLGIINDILDFSKIEAGKMKMEAIEFAPETVIDQLISTLALQAEEKGLEFLIRYDINIPAQLIGDPLRLGQVLLNLSNNAIKFTDSGEVEIAMSMQSMTSDELILHVAVRDTGIGMSAEQQEKLFHRFSQADQSNTRRFGGTGLGLAISMHLVELMGGRLWIDHSAPNEGTTMCCTMRFGIVPQVEHQRQALLSKVSPLLKGSRVLVVDDNIVSRQILSETLHNFGIEVDAVADGESAIEQVVNAGPYAVVLMDWRMTGMTGDVAVKRILADQRIEQKPKIVMVTAYGSEPVYQAAQRAGVDGFLSKPVSPSMLLDTLLTVVGRERALPSFDQPYRALGNAPRNFAGVHVLLVEDNDINREFAEELLRSMSIKVSTAVNGLEAVEKARQSGYDAILMDVQMPELDGYEATQRIRALSQTEDDRFAAIPIIAMTALAMSPDRKKSLEAGMNDHISKPVDPDQLEHVLLHWLEKPGREKSEQATYKKESAVNNDNMFDLKSIDTAQAIRRIGGNTKVYWRQLKRFRGYYTEAADKLKGLIEQKGAAEAEGYCHSLKGVCGNIGATELAACVTEMDDLLKQGQEPTEEQFGQMKVLLVEVIKDIDSLADHMQAESGPAMDVPTMIEHLEQLSSLLPGDVAEAEEVLDKLLLNLDWRYADPMSKIASSIELYEVDHALAAIAALITQLKQSL